jgi:NADH-quinone oxidoreductase subunit N
LAEWAGIGWRRPMIGVAMTLFLFSLAGIPPTGGFLGKYVIFKAAVNADHIPLAIVMAVNAAIAAYYYLRVIVYMYMRESEVEETPLPVTPAMATVMILSSVAILYLGLAPSRVFDAIAGIAGSLL